MMVRLTRKFLLFLAGPFAVSTTSIAAITGVWYRTGLSWYILAEMIGFLVAVRLLLILMRGPKPVFEDRPIRKRMKWLVEDESKISLLFISACFLLSWNLTISNVLVFVIANFIGQLAGVLLNNRLLDIITHRLGSNGSAKKVLIIGSGKRGQKVADSIVASPQSDSELVGFLDFKRKGLWRYRDMPLLGHPKELAKIAATCQIDALYIAVENDEWLFAEKIYREAEEMGLTVCVDTDLFDSNLYRSQPGFVNGSPVMVYRAIPDNQLKLFTKNMFDRLFALAVLLVSAPILALISLAIKLDSRGPVLFKQVRSGLNGRLFPLYKFRTMGIDAEKKKKELEKLNEMSGPVFKIRNDPRVTRIGKFLRKTSLDEFPQFLNVLKGDMSVVGPRPPIPKEVENYEPWQHRRLSVKPGITCTWQVSGRNQIDFDDWIRLDLAYIDNWSLWNDTKIIARTVPAVLKGDGAS